MVKNRNDRNYWTYEKTIVEELKLLFSCIFGLLQDTINKNIYNKYFSILIF